MLRAMVIHPVVINVQEIKGHRIVSLDKKCMNCARYKKKVVNHSAIDRCCPAQESEIGLEIVLINDHGY